LGEISKEGETSKKELERKWKRREKRERGPNKKKSSETREAYDRELEDQRKKKKEEERRGDPADTHIRKQQKNEYKKTVVMYVNTCVRARLITEAQTQRVLTSEVSVHVNVK
jgi:hypothetical protein